MQIIYRKSFYILVLSALITGCYKSYLPFGNQSKIGVLNDIPTPPHQNKVAVYFPGEYPEDKEYVKIKVLETIQQNYGINTAVAGTINLPTYAHLVDGIRAQAQKEGMDAVMIIDRAALVSNASISPGVDIVMHSSLAAVGIKFKKNLTYLDNYVQRQNVLLADSAEGFKLKPAVRYEYDLGGIITKQEGEAANKMQQLHENYVQKYTYNFLVNDKSNAWRYYKDEFGITKRRIYSLPNQQIPQDMHVKLHYNSQKQVDKVYLTFPTAYNKPKETVYFKFDEQNRVTEFEVEQNRKRVLRGTNQYDESNRLVSQNIYKLKAGLEKPFIKIQNEYFAKNYAYQYNN